jgi:hypothetical protein
MMRGGKPKIAASPVALALFRIAPQGPNGSSYESIAASFCKGMTT